MQFGVVKFTIDKVFTGRVPVELQDLENLHLAVLIVEDHGSVCMIELQFVGVFVNFAVVYEFIVYNVV